MTENQQLNFGKDIIEPLLKKNGGEIKEVGLATIINTDCLVWMKTLPDNSLQAIVTDPPYGVKEYEDEDLYKRNIGKGGVWRLPPAFDGSVRAPLPRFTALTKKEVQQIYHFFLEWAKEVNRVVAPGGHIIIATNSFIAPTLYRALEDGGLEFRDQIMRLVRTLRGGDRPKNAEDEFPDVNTLPRGCYEPWGVFRVPIPKGMRVQDTLRKYGTGGLRRLPNGMPFEDIIKSERTPKREKLIADHPSLKPQGLMRQLVYASLPTGKGIVYDPFMGSGSTLAAANSVGYKSVGTELYKSYFDLATNSIEQLSKIEVRDLYKSS